MTETIRNRLIDELQCEFLILFGGIQNIFVGEGEMTLQIFLHRIKPYRLLLVVLGLLTIQIGIARSSNYHNYKSLKKHLVSLAEKEPGLVRIESIAQSIGKRKIWMVEVGKGSEESRSFLLINLALGLKFFTAGNL